MHRHSSHNTTILQLYITYQLHVSAISDLAIIRLDTIIRETIKRNIIFSLLYRACCQVTQLLYQPLHLYKFYKFM